MSNNPTASGYRAPTYRPPVNAINNDNNAYVMPQPGQQPQNQNDPQRNPSVNVPQRQSMYPGGFAVPNVQRPYQQPPSTYNQNSNAPMPPNINTQVQNSQYYDRNNNGPRNSVMMSPGTYSTPYQSPYNQNGPYYPPTMSQTDLQRKFYGTCHGCKQPNTDFASCQSCSQWLTYMESMTNQRKALIQKQFCELCKLPKHVHHQIAACGKCGFPRSNVEELSKVAVKKEQSDSIFEDAKIKEQLGFVCTNCNQSLEGFLKCPTYGEVATRMRKEREQVAYEDPNFKKLSEIVKEYSDKEKKMKPPIQKSTKPNFSGGSGDKINELTNMTKELHIDGQNNQGNYTYGAYLNQTGYGGHIR